ncbi:MAG: large conductance mechanosensitive channel protein MscL [Methanosarcinaceae archaeon]|nr:large conductance mechanosensitive channel protein MscL [Methanosarcinaceae archaeon]
MLKETWKEFKEFAFKGNVVDMAVGIMIGAAFGKIVTSLVNDIFMPVISLFTGGSDISKYFISLDGNAYESVEAAQAAGAAIIQYGNFFLTVIDFLIIALCIFAIVKLLSKLKKKEPEKPAEPVRLCNFCKMEVAKDATRCPHCTSELKV